MSNVLIRNNSSFKLKHILILIATCILLLFLVASVFPTLLTPHDPLEQSLYSRLQGPGFMDDQGRLYRLGTDNLGRDIFTRLIYGARVSLLVGVMSTLFSASFGVTSGLLSGYYGGLLNDVIMRLADVQLAFPFFLLAITVVGVLGPSIPVVIIVLALGNWVAYGRVIRSQVLEIRERQFVLAARAIGLPKSRIIIFHILPNVISSIIVLATFNVAFAIVMEAGLSFVGLGIPAKLSSWGDMLSVGRQYVDTSWWLATFPGASIFVVVLAINILGDQLRESLDPHMKHRQA